MVSIDQETSSPHRNRAVAVFLRAVMTSLRQPRFSVERFSGTFGADPWDRHCPADGGEGADFAPDCPWECVGRGVAQVG